MAVEEQFEESLFGPLLRFQQITLEPLLADLDSGTQIGPTWDEVAENDWSLGKRPVISSERAIFARIVFDVASCLVQLRGCKEGLIEQRRRRQPFPSFTQAEIVLIASDAVVYRLLERMASFCGHPVVKASIIGALGRPPKRLTEIRRRRGSHTHHFDEPLIEASSSSLLLSVMQVVPDSDDNTMRRLVLSEARRVYRERISDEISNLDEVIFSATKWIDDVLRNTEATWTAYLRRTA